ncbi:MAG: phosphoenolpyruvate--protein phosphotransferase [Thermodesulfobacteriota bacterium]
MTADGREEILTGIPGSPGICIGPAYLVDRQDFDVVDRYALDQGEVAEEVARFKKAVRKADSELTKLIKKSPKEFSQHAYILEAHKALLHDNALYGRTIETIKKMRVNSEWALKTAVDRVRLVFSRIEDSYIRERVSDVSHVYNRVMRNLMGSQDVELDKINRRVILVARDISPAEASQLQLEWVMSFITDLGGRTSHTSIIARTLQIPAVLGLSTATQKIRTGDIIIVDGAAGVVVVNPDDETLAKYQEIKDRYEAYRAQVARKSHLPAETRDGMLVAVNGNIELAEEVVAVLDLGGDGIGLYRTEFLYLNRRTLPTEQELFETYKDIAEILNPRPVTIRTLDINGDKVASGIMTDEGDNPALGLRAIRFCLKFPEIFKNQLRAILRASAYGNVRLLIPMISNVEEILAVRRLIAEAADELAANQEPYSDKIELGIMIEVPSAAIAADLFAPHVDFFSLGTNDLIQYTLAVDRGNKHVADLFSSLHPAVLRLLKNVASVSAKHHVRLAMCGEMAGDPLHAPLLLAMGFTELSMHPRAIPTVKNTVRTLEMSECKKLFNRAMKKSTCGEVRDLLESFSKEKAAGGQPGANKP